METKILLVDDNVDFRKVVRYYLEGQDVDFRIFEAGSGEKAVSFVAQKNPEVVLMDIRLPEMNGIETAGRIKELDPYCNIIILTMFETEELKKVYRKGNFTAFISKSDIYERLMPILKKCLKEKYTRSSV